MKIKFNAVKLLYPALLLGLASAAFAQEPADDILNKHLGPAGKANAPATQPADEKTSAPAQKLTTDEQKLLEKLDNAALSKMLLEGKETGGMTRVLELMGVSCRQLAEKFDPGKVTQTVQKQIIIDLDAAIAQAKKNQGQGSGQSDNPDPNSKRESGQGEKEKPKDSQNGKPDPSPSEQGSTPGAGGGPAQPAGALRYDNVERHREWGGLPARDREEIIQTGSDQPLEKFRELIDRYYSALNKEE